MTKLFEVSPIVGAPLTFFTTSVNASVGPLSVDLVSLAFSIGPLSVSLNVLTLVGIGMVAYLLLVAK